MCTWKSMIVTCFFLIGAESLVWNQPSPLKWCCLSLLSWTSARTLKMTSPVTKAMIESYALMVLVMGSFFVYFCGMVWTFCNPKLSGAEEHGGTANQTDVEPGAHGGTSRCACSEHPPAESLSETTYVNFWDDSSLLTDSTASSRDDLGITQQMEESPSWTESAETVPTFKRYFIYYHLLIIICSLCITC